MTMRNKLILLVVTVFWTTTLGAREQNIFPQLRSNRRIVQRRPSRKKNVCGTKLCRRLPSPEFIRSQVFGNRVVTFNHESVGMTHPYVSVSKEDAQLVSSGRAERKWWPSSFCKSDGWRKICLRSENVGQGEACYRRVRDAALNWEFTSDSMGIIAAASRDNESNCVSHETFARYGGGRKLATYTKKGFFHNILFCAVNPVIVVYDLVDERSQDSTYSSTAYATAQGHWLRGEERVSVILRDETDQVDVEILSYSKPNNPVIWPFIGKMQRQFFEQQLQTLNDVAKIVDQDNENKPSSPALWPAKTGPFLTGSEASSVRNASYP